MSKQKKAKESKCLKEIPEEQRLSEKKKNKAYDLQNAQYYYRVIRCANSSDINKVLYKARNHPLTTAEIVKELKDSSISLDFCNRPNDWVNTELQNTLKCHVVKKKNDEGRNTYTLKKESRKIIKNLKRKRKSKKTKSKKKRKVE